MRIGFYDEGMLLYSTEDDLCRRMAQAGWRIAVNRQARIVDHLSGSVRKIPPLGCGGFTATIPNGTIRSMGLGLERLAAKPLPHLAYLVEAIVVTLGYRMEFRP